MLLNRKDPVSAIPQLMKEIEKLKTEGTTDSDLEHRIEEIESQKMLRLEIKSSRGNVFKNGNVETTLIAVVFSWDKDVTAQYDENQFRWTRVSDDPESDKLWNSRNAGGKRILKITSNDVFGRATFFCDLVDGVTGRSILN